MFIDSGSKRPGDVETTRVCIVGSGPAGLTLGLDLAKRGLDVIVLEAGEESVSRASQDFYRGTVVGGPYYDLSEARLRTFGGSSVHWGGYCRAIDRRIFEGNPAVGRVPWPISIDALSPYLARACEILEIENDFEDEILAPGIRHGKLQFSPPVVFGHDQYDEIEGSDRLRLALNSALIGVEARDSRVFAADVRTGDTTWRVEADAFVFCMGGIETPRMLLWINEQHDRRLLANHDVIGRWWMEHPLQMNLADAVLDSRLLRFANHNDEITLALTPDVQHEHGLLDMAFRAKSYDRPYLQGLLIDLACHAPELADRLAGLAGKNLVCGAMLYGEWEQAPRREHRVALGSERDPFGIPRVELHWRRDPRAQRTMHASLRLLADRIAAGGLGRVRLEEWVLDPEVEPLPSDKMAGWHHMGGARMSLTPRDGVVDADLKVHGVDNLFVCSSAVFPNGGGFANPTFTIVQLALRLSERLASTRI